MSSFFRKIPQPLVVLVLVLVVLPGHALAAEGDPSASAPVVDSTPVADNGPDAPAPDDSPEGPDGSGGGSSNLPSGFGGYDTFTVSGADVTVNVQRHDTLFVPSVASDVVSSYDHFARAGNDTATPTLAETIRSLFGTYTPRTQTVTTYYDGQPISTEEQIVPGLAGLDYEWLAGVSMFALVTFCLFRLLGGILKNG